MLRIRDILIRIRGYVLTDPYPDPALFVSELQDSIKKYLIDCLKAGSVADPDPPDPHVLGLLDSDSDPLVKDMDPDPSIIKQK